MTLPAPISAKPPRAKRDRQRVPVNRRLGFRIGEYADMLGVSRVTIWRGIRNNKIKVVDQNGVKIIPRSFAVKSGLISSDDTV